MFDPKRPLARRVDANTDGGIEEITEKGIRAGGKEYEFDIIVFATGFDAMTGPLKAMNLKGRGGRTLDEQWADGPHTYLGISIAGFPNLFTITGPQSPSVLSNMPVSIEQHVEWVTDCIDHMRKTGKTTIEPTPEAQDQWVAHVNEIVNQTLMTGANSWYMSANIAGKPRAFLPYLGPEGVGGYRRNATRSRRRATRGSNWHSRLSVCKGISAALLETPPRRKPGPIVPPHEPITVGKPCDCLKSSR